jgi:class 3 adenylate cyclase
MDTPFFLIDRARKLVANIPDSRLSIIGGKSPFAWDRFVVDATHSFIEETAGAEQRKRYGVRSPSAFRTILFTDVEGHGSMMARLGDSRGRAVLREHERITREALREHGGSEIKAMGDGFLASFTSAQKALECSMSLQRAISELHIEDDSAEELPFRIRIGVNAGEPIAEDDDLFGSSVIAAARIAAMAQGGEVLVANVVRELVSGKGFLFNDRGESALRGLEDPVRLWDLRWRE